MLSAQQPREKSTSFFSSCSKVLELNLWAWPDLLASFKPNPLDRKLGLSAKARGSGWLYWDFVMWVQGRVFAPRKIWVLLLEEQERKIRAIHCHRSPTLIYLSTYIAESTLPPDSRTSGADFVRRALEPMWVPLTPLCPLDQGTASSKNILLPSDKTLAL